MKAREYINIHSLSILSLLIIFVTFLVCPVDVDAFEFSAEVPTPTDPGAGFPIESFSLH